jgi:hypothetical protein
MPETVALSLTHAELAELLHEFDIPVDAGYRLTVTRQTETDRLRAFFKVLLAQKKVLGVTNPPVTFTSNQIDILADALLTTPAKAAKPAKPAKAPTGRKRGRPRKHPRQTTIDEALTASSPAMTETEHARIIDGRDEAER